MLWGSHSVFAPPQLFPTTIVLFNFWNVSLFKAVYMTPCVPCRNDNFWPLPYPACCSQHRPPPSKNVNGEVTGKGKGKLSYQKLIVRPTVESTDSTPKQKCVLSFPPTPSPLHDS